MDVTAFEATTDDRVTLKECYEAYDALPDNFKSIIRAVSSVAVIFAKLIYLNLTACGLAASIALNLSCVILFWSLTQLFLTTANLLRCIYEAPEVAKDDAHMRGELRKVRGEEESSGGSEKLLADMGIHQGSSTDNSPRLIDQADLDMFESFLNSPSTSRAPSTTEVPFSYNEDQANAARDGYTVQTRRDGEVPGTVITQDESLEPGTATKGQRQCGATSTTVGDELSAGTSANNASEGHDQILSTCAASQHAPHQTDSLLDHDVPSEAQPSKQAERQQKKAAENIAFIEKLKAGSLTAAQEQPPKTVLPPHLRRPAIADGSTPIRSAPTTAVPPHVLQPVNTNVSQQGQRVAPTTTRPPGGPPAHSQTQPSAKRFTAEQMAEARGFAVEATRGKSSGKSTVRAPAHKASDTKIKFSLHKHPARFMPAKPKVSSPISTSDDFSSGVPPPHLEKGIAARAARVGRLWKASNEGSTAEQAGPRITDRPAAGNTKESTNIDTADMENLAQQDFHSGVPESLVKAAPQVLTLDGESSVHLHSSEIDPFRDALPSNAQRNPEGPSDAALPRLASVESLFELDARQYSETPGDRVERQGGTLRAEGNPPPPLIKPVERYMSRDFLMSFNTSAAPNASDQMPHAAEAGGSGDQTLDKDVGRPEVQCARCKRWTCSNTRCTRCESWTCSDENSHTPICPGCQAVEDRIDDAKRVISGQTVHVTEKPSHLPARTNQNHHTQQVPSGRGTGLARSTYNGHDDAPAASQEGDDAKKSNQSPERKAAAKHMVDVLNRKVGEKRASIDSSSPEKGAQAPFEATSCGPLPQNGWGSGQQSSIPSNPSSTGTDSNAPEPAVHAPSSIVLAPPGLSRLNGVCQSTFDALLVESSKGLVEPAVMENGNSGSQSLESFQEHHVETGDGDDVTSSETDLEPACDIDADTEIKQESESETQSSLRKKKTVVRQALVQAWLEREKTRKRVAATFTFDGRKALEEATKIYNSHRAELTNCMANRELPEDVAKTFPHFSLADLSAPRVRPFEVRAALQQLRIENVNAPTPKQKGKDENTTPQRGAAEIEELKTKAINARNVYVNAHEYFQGPHLKVESPNASW